MPSITFCLRYVARYTTVLLCLALHPSSTLNPSNLGNEFRGMEQAAIPVLILLYVLIGHNSRPYLSSCWLICPCGCIACLIPSPACWVWRCSKQRVLSVLLISMRIHTHNSRPYSIHPWLDRGITQNNLAYLCSYSHWVSIPKITWLLPSIPCLQSVLGSHK